MTGEHRFYLPLRQAKGALAILIIINILVGILVILGIHILPRAYHSYLFGQLMALRARPI